MANDFREAEHLSIALGNRGTTLMPQPRPGDHTLDWRDDPANPHNWPPARKYTVTILLSTFSFNTLMCSTMVAPALSQIKVDLAISSDAETQLVLSIYVLSYAVGYFLWAPLSELYGRKSILQLANAWFCVWNMVCGFSRNEATITVARLLSGAGASSTLALGTGAIGEIWRPAQRGRSLAILSLVTLLGPCIGPVIGGSIAYHSWTSWRWAFWSTTIFNAILQLISIRFMHESHAPTILRRLAKSSDSTRTLHEQISSTSTTTDVLLKSLRRPFYLILSQPVMQALTIYTGIAFGSLYVVLAIIPIAFTQIYQQSLIVASLNYLSFGIGTTLGAQICAPIIDHMYKRRTRQEEAQLNAGYADDALKTRALKHMAVVEIRLYPLIPTIVFMVIGLIIFGWGIHFHEHWVVPNIGIMIFSAGNQSMTQCTNAYIIDVFSELSRESTGPHIGESNARTSRVADTISSESHLRINWASSAMASIWAAKSLGGFTFPLFAVNMIRGLGWGWSFTLLAMLNITIGLPVACTLLAWGKTLREKGRVSIDKQIDSGKV